MKRILLPLFISFSVFAGSPTIFNGIFTKSLKPNLNLFDQAYILTGSVDPSIVATNGPGGSMFMRSTGQLYVKTDSGTSTNWTLLGSGGGGSGTVTSVSVASANGFSGSVATATTTPAITLSTSISGIVSGSAGALTAAGPSNLHQLNGISQGGDSYAATINIGSNDNNSFNLRTNGTNRLFIDPTGVVTVGNDAATFSPLPPGIFGAAYVSPMLEPGFDLGVINSADYTLPADYSSDTVNTGFITSLDTNGHSQNGSIAGGIFNTEVNGAGGVGGSIQNVKSEVEYNAAEAVTGILGFSATVERGGGTGEIVTAAAFNVDSVEAVGTSSSTATNHLAAGLRVNSVHAADGTGGNTAAGVYIPSASITASGTGAFAYALLIEDASPSSFAGPVWTPLLSLNGIGISQAPESFLSFNTGSLLAVTANQIVGIGLATRAMTVENISGVASSRTCSVDPVITLLDCGTTPTDCTTGTTTLSSLTFTAANTVTTNTISVPDILAGHYWAFQVTAGTCTAFNLTGSAGVRMQ